MSRMKTLLKFCSISLGIAMLLTILSCDPVLDRPFFTFENKSDQTVGFIIRHVPPEAPYSRAETLSSTNMYPGNNTFTVWHNEVEMYKAFEKYPVLYLYIFNADTLFEAFVAATEYKLIESHRELKMMELTKQYMEEHDWTVTYP